MSESLPDRVARAIEEPLPELGPWKRLWWVGTGPFHDAAELGTFPFAGSGRSAAAVSGEGHARLGELLGPQDACVLVGGDAELLAFARRVAGGTGARVIELTAPVENQDDPTTRFVLAACRVLALCEESGAPGADATDLRRLPAAIDQASSDHSALDGELSDRVLVMGSGPAAITARHLAVRLREADAGRAVEGMDAQEVPGVAADLLGPGTTVVALDPDRDPTAPVARMARMARMEGATVREVPGDAALGPLPGSVVLALNRWNPPPS